MKCDECGGFMEWPRKCSRCGGDFCLAHAGAGAHDCPVELDELDDDTGDAFAE